MAKWLSSQYGWPLAEEYARHYLEHDGHIQDAKALINVAKAQVAAEVYAAAGDKHKVLICDSDMLVLYIWCTDKFHKVPPALSALVKHHAYDLTMLCVPDIPWIPDPHRVNPLDRARLFNQYKTELIKMGRLFVEIKGDQGQRKQLAEKSITQLLKA